ncbi:MAG: DUF4129 domain-containing protein [Okeania sp. SIO2D1]|nr:DUF4129 domain-containing protein [Okeania sp. SIO2D1]
MSNNGSFERNGVGWQLNLLRKRLGEWLELQTSDAFNNWSIPEWLRSPWLIEIAKLIFWLILTLMILWIILQLWQVVVPYLYNLSKQRERPTRKNTHQTKELSTQAWLARAKKFQSQQNYRQGCLCLYQAMLQLLSDRGIIPQQSSRTDGEYRQLIENLPPLNAYETLLATHEQLCFSLVEATSSVFTQCQQAYQKIQASKASLP